LYIVKNKKEYSVKDALMEYQKVYEQNAHGLLEIDKSRPNPTALDARGQQKPGIASTHGRRDDGTDDDAISSRVDTINEIPTKDESSE
jgi:hypothetical protein